MARFATVGEAQAACSALRAAGIEARLGDENLIAIDWLYSQAVGSIKVLVPQEDLEQAREIISISPSTPAEGEPEPERAAAWPPHSRPPSCPECGSNEVRPIPRWRILALSTALFTGLGFVSGFIGLGVTAAVGAALALLLTPSHRCAACGHRWNLPPDDRVVEAPPPDPVDTIEEPCPRCGSLDVYRIDYRRLKAVPLLFNAAILVVFPVWLALPKRRCDACGLELR